jgi:predicted Fe-Mo cluster-binding NifX family protein
MVNTRVLIPVFDQEGQQVADHFGRAPFFAVFEFNDQGTIISRAVVPNTGEHSGGRGHAHDNVLRHTPNVVIVQGMGPRGLMSFQGQSIAVLRANSRMVDDVLKAYARSELQELTDGCADAHHK